MMYKRKIYSGVVLEQEVYSAPDRIKNAPDIERRLWMAKTEEEKRKVNELHSKKRFIRLVNENFSAGGLYATLTYNDEHLPQTYEKAEKELRNFIRKLRYKFPGAVIVAVTGYGKKSGRLHHHIIISGVWESYIIEKWKHGMVTRIEPLRAHNVYDGKDCGRDYTGLAIYLWKHSKDKPKKGKRWYQTKNCVQPEAEEAQEIKRNYSKDKPPRTPKGYVLVHSYEGRNGYLYFKYVKEISPRKRSREEEYIS